MLEGRRRVGIAIENRPKRGLERRAYARVIVTRRGKPIAELAPPRRATPKLWGSLRGSIDIAPGVDLTEPVLDEPLDAEQGILSR